MLTLIRAAKLNDVEPQGVLAWIADHKITDLPRCCLGIGATRSPPASEVKN